MSVMDPSDFCPYVGLRPFTPEEAAYFFGRERELRVVYSNLLAAPLTVLYGPSGCGKSSVLQAGLVPMVKKRGTGVAIVYFNRWQEPEFLDQLKDECVKQAQKASQKPCAVDTRLPLDELVRGIAEEVGVSLLIIFDQFEEYLLYNPESVADRPFEAEFSRAVGDNDGTASFLVALREDSMSKLDRFRIRIPNLLGNTLRLLPLDLQGAKDAIRKPLDAYASECERKGSVPEGPVGIEEDVITSVLDEIRPLQAAQLTGSVGLGTISSSTCPEEFEASLLQVVMTRLWSEEQKHHSKVIRQGTLTGLKGAKHIVETHLDRIMGQLAPRERDTAARIFRFLITPSGSKIAYGAYDLAENSNSNRKLVSTTLGKLVTNGILRQLKAPERFELLHDILAPAILTWRDRQDFRRRRDRWITWTSIALASLGLTALVSAKVAWGKSEEARETMTQLIATKLLEAAARENDGSQLQLAYALRAHALLEEADLQSGSTRQQIENWALRTTWQGEVSDLAFMKTPKGEIAVITDFTGKVVQWDPQAGNEIKASEPHGVNQVEAAWPISPGGSRLVLRTGSDENYIWRPFSSQPPEPIEGTNMRVLALSETDGRLLAGDRDRNHVELRLGTSAPAVRLAEDVAADFLVADMVVFRPGGNEIAVLARGRKLQVWRESGGRLEPLKLPGSLEKGIDHIAFSRDGRYLAGVGKSSFFVSDFEKREAGDATLLPCETIDPPAIENRSSPENAKSSNIYTSFEAAGEWVAVAIESLPNSYVLAACDAFGHCYRWKGGLRAAPVVTPTLQSRAVVISPGLDWVTAIHETVTFAPLDPPPNSFARARQRIGNRKLSFSELNAALGDIAPGFASGTEAAAAGRFDEAKNRFQETVKFYRTLDANFNPDLSREVNLITAREMLFSASRAQMNGELEEAIRDLEKANLHVPAGTGDEMAEQARRGLATSAFNRARRAAKVDPAELRQLFTIAENAWPAILQGKPAEEWVRETKVEMILRNAGRLAETGTLDSELSQIRGENPQLPIGFEQSVKTAAGRQLVERAGLTALDDEATAQKRFELAEQLDPALKEEISRERQKIEARRWRARAVESIENGNFRDAVSQIEKARMIAPEIISANDWNSLCWRGSLNGYHREVLFAGDEAVKALPQDPQVRDTRGVARSLAGDLAGALEDFEIALKNESEESNEYKWHKQWISALNEGRNPITPEVLARLKEGLPPAK